MNGKFNGQSQNIWWIAIIFLGALLASQCDSSREGTSVVEVPTPVVSNFIMSGSSDELLPEDEVKIWVNVDVCDPEIPIVYTWSPEGGDIIKGQGTSNITYKAPDAPGTYRISLKVEYGDCYTEKSTYIIVASPTPTPTPTPTGTPTPTNTSTPTKTPPSTPTDTPTPTLTPTPTPTGTPTPTPTPTLLPPPTPLAPESGECFLGGSVTFRWQLDYGPLAQDEIFSLRVCREGEIEPCHHDKTKGLEYSSHLSYCTAGKHYWSVALVRQLCKHCPEEDKWQPLSKPSEERAIYYTPSDEPWKPPPPPGDDDDDDDDNGGGGGVPGG